MEPTAFGILRDYLEARAAFGAGDVDLIRSVFVFKRLSASEFLQRDGDITRHAAFVACGCLRNYVIDAKGKEHIVQFAPETWWLADATSLNGGTPSTFFIDAIEDSELLLIDRLSHQMLVNRVAGYAAAFRRGLQRHARSEGSAHRQLVERLRRRTVHRVHEGLSIHCSAVPPS